MVKKESAMNSIIFDKRKKSGILFLFLLLSVSHSAAAAQFLTLHDAVSSALDNDKSYLSVKEQVNESRLKEREAWGQLWPDIGTSFAATKVGAEKGPNNEIYGEYDFSFITGTLAINPGIFYNTLKGAREGHLYAVNEERRSRAETTVRAIKLYYTVILDREILQLRENSVKALEENLRVITAAYKNGSMTNLDFLRAQVSTANEKTRLIAAESSLRNAKASLNVMMGKDLSEKIEIDPKASTVTDDELRIFASLSEKDEANKIAMMTTEAMKNRPELVQLTAKKGIAEAKENAASAVYIWPTFSVSGNYGTSEILNKSFTYPADSSGILLKEISQEFSPNGWNKGWSVTAAASYKFGALSPLDASHARAGQFESQARQTNLEMEGLVQKIQLDIQQGLLKMESAASGILSQKENILSAEEYFRVASLQFRNGMIDNTKLLEANVELQNAKTMYSQALFDMETAKAEINRAIGYDYFAL
jgi:outer membrane protein TolC